MPPSYERAKGVAIGYCKVDLVGEVKLGLEVLITERQKRLPKSVLVLLQALKKFLTEY